MPIYYDYESTDSRCDCEDCSKRESPRKCESRSSRCESRSKKSSHESCDRCKCGKKHRTSREKRSRHCEKYDKGENNNVICVLDQESGRQLENEYCEKPKRCDSDAKYLIIKIKQCNA